ncbi:MAG: HAMP domain-containing protein [Acidobacteria bacterium]|nr:HAMP domain-containing protein [Acidobacteriota bacterium]
MFNSIRAHLTLWYAAVLTLVLIAFAVTVYFLLAQTISRLTDNSLKDVNDSLIASIAAEKDEDEEKSDGEIFNEKLQEDFRFRDLAFIVFDEKQNVVAKSFDANNRANSQLPKFEVSAAQIPPEIIKNSAQNAEYFQTFFLPDKTEVKIFAQIINFNGQNYVVAILRSLTEQNQLLAKIRFIFFVVIPLVLLAAIFGGYYLARKSLAPVVEMNKKAALISSTNLNERLPIANEKDELGELATTFNQLLSRLETSFEQQRRFMADASHELRTPLAIVRGEAEVALQKDSRSKDEYRESLEIIDDESKRLTRIVEDLFTLARADAGQYPLQKTDFYLDELLAECGRAVRTLFAKNNLSFNLETENELLFHGDETLIRRLIMNLLDNAIKYTPPIGEIFVSCKSEDGNYEIKVFNTGEAIPPEAQTHIFERFYRTDKARSRQKENEIGTGAGLGLSIGRWIAKAHDGCLELLFSNNLQTAFIISLPFTSKTKYIFRKKPRC